MFTDTVNYWAKDDIALVAVRDLLTGTGNNQFSPNDSITRGIFVTALGRLAGVDTTKYTNTRFTDVAANAYYAPYVAWVIEQGIADGTSIADFARDAVKATQMAGVMNGKDGNRFCHRSRDRRRSAVICGTGSRLIHCTGTDYQRQRQHHAVRKWQVGEICKSHRERRNLSL